MKFIFISTVLTCMTATLASNFDHTCKRKTNEILNHFGINESHLVSDNQEFFEQYEKEIKLTQSGEEVFELNYKYTFWGSRRLDVMNLYLHESQPSIYANKKTYTHDGTSIEAFYGEDGYYGSVNVINDDYIISMNFPDRHQREWNDEEDPDCWVQEYEFLRRNNYGGIGRPPELFYGGEKMGCRFASYFKSRELYNNLGGEYNYSQVYDILRSKKQEEIQNLKNGDIIIATLEIGAASSLYPISQETIEEVISICGRYPEFFGDHKVSEDMSKGMQSYLSDEIDDLVSNGNIDQIRAESIKKLFEDRK
ncbi:hypothetical protein N9N67_02265 [Bacteriovoracaceae bacterium]|nr:hypothetical protein [Bacteriovoracaceae bacterium]